MRVHGALYSRKAGNARGITVPREKSRWTLDLYCRHSKLPKEQLFHRPTVKSLVHQTQ